MDYSRNQWRQITRQTNKKGKNGMENCKEEMGLIRTVGTATAAAATALTVSYACASFSSASSSSSPSAQVPKTLNLSFLSPPHRSRLIGAAADPPAALKMDGPSTNHTSSSQVRFHIMDFSFIFLF